MLDIEQIIQKNQGSIWNFWRKNIQWYLTNQYKRITKLVKNGYYLKKSYFKHAKGTPLPKDYTVALRHEDVELSVKHIQNVIMFILFFHMKDKSWLRSWKNKIGHLPSSCTLYRKRLRHDANANGTTCKDMRRSLLKRKWFFSTLKENNMHSHKHVRT